MCPPANLVPETYLVFDVAGKDYFTSYRLDKEKDSMITTAMNLRESFSVCILQVQL